MAKLLSNATIFILLVSLLMVECYDGIYHFYCSKDGGKEELCPWYYTGDFYLKDTQRKPKKEICHNATTSGILEGEEFDFSKEIVKCITLYTYMDYGYPGDILKIYISYGERFENKELLVTGKKIRDEQNQLAADTHTKLVLFNLDVYRTTISSSNAKLYIEIGPKRLESTFCTRYYHIVLDCDGSNQCVSE